MSCKCNVSTYLIKITDGLNYNYEYYGSEIPNIDDNFNLVDDKFKKVKKISWNFSDKIVNIILE